MFRILLIVIIFLVSSFSALAQSNKKLYIRSFHPATNFLVIDPLGRRTGFDPIIKTRYSEVPNKAYVEDNFSGDEQDSSYLYVTNDNEVIDGKYQIKIVGESDSFSLSIDYSGNYSVDVQDMTYPQKVDYYEFEYNYEQIKKGIPIKVIRIITSSTLIDDIKVLEKQHFLSNNIFASELMQDVLKIEEYKDVNVKKAKYKEFIQKITQKYNKSEKDIYVTGVALGMLQRDVEYIINHAQ